jgi:3-hydroxyisobutyrate dehydrogenase-like beta-hydroxyacid dehydrogenase
MGRPRVGVVGVGNMGSGIARALLRAGLSTAVCDQRRDAVVPLVAEGATVAPTPAALASGSDVVCVVVFDGAQVDEVMFGDDGVVSGAAPGTVVCICSTVSVAVVRDAYRGAAEHAVRVIDAGVAGGPRALEGGLVTFVGGDDEDVAAARPALEAFSRDIVHAGPLGSGMQLKLVKNLVSYTTMSAVHEGMWFAEELGIAPEAARHALEETYLLDDFFHSVTVRASARPLDADTDPGEVEQRRFYAGLARKDLAAIQAEAAAHGLELPVARVAWEQAPRYFLVPRDRDVQG